MIVNIGAEAEHLNLRPAASWSMGGKAIKHVDGKPENFWLFFIISVHFAWYHAVLSIFSHLCSLAKIFVETGRLCSAPERVPGQSVSAATTGLGREKYSELMMIFCILSDYRIDGLRFFLRKPFPPPPNRVLVLSTQCCSAPS